MTHKYSFCFFSLLLTVALIPTGLSQAQTRTPRRPAQPSLFTALPTSDAVAVVKIKRVLDEALPKLLASSPTRLAEANAQIDKFKTSTGVDPRSFEQMVFGIRYSFPSEGVTKLRTVALARGTFSPGAMVAAGRIAADGKYREERHNGKTIYVFSLDQQIRLFGVFDGRIGDLAVCPLDSNTLALGELQLVQEVIDLKKAVTTNSELIALATKDPNALAGFGGNISEQLRNNFMITNDAIARDLTAVRQAYGSVGMTEKDLEVTLAARTVDEYSARNLGGTVEALKQFGGLFVNRLPAAKAALARSALNGLKITNQGNELWIKTTIAQAEIAPVMAGL